MGYNFVTNKPLHGIADAGYGPPEPNAQAMDLTPAPDAPSSWAKLMTALASPEAATAWQNITAGLTRVENSFRPRNEQMPVPQVNQLAPLQHQTLVQRLEKEKAAAHEKKRLDDAYQKYRRTLSPNMQRMTDFMPRSQAVALAAKMAAAKPAMPFAMSNGQIFNKVTGKTTGAPKGTPAMQNMAAMYGPNWQTNPQAVEQFKRIIEKQLSGVSAAQQANNIEIEAARKRIATFKPEPGETFRAAILRRIQRTSDIGRENPSFDPMIARDFRIATQRMVGDDPDYAKFLASLDIKAAQPTPTSASPTVIPRNDALAAATAADDAVIEAYGGADPSSTARFRTTVANIGGTPAEMSSPMASRQPPAPRQKPRGPAATARLRTEMRLPARGRGKGTQAQPFRPDSEEDFAAIRSGEFYFNQADQKVYRKK